MTAETSLAFPTTAGWRPHPRYPDPAIEAVDTRFEPYWIKQSAVERLYTGRLSKMRPVWFGDGRYLLWSDIPNNRILKGAKRQAPSACFADHRTSPMATPATGRGVS